MTGDTRLQDEWTTLTVRCTVAPIAGGPLDAKDWLMVQHAIPGDQRVRGSTTAAPAPEWSGSSIAQETAVLDARRASEGHVTDVESLRWLRALSGVGRVREDAAERLHALLVRATKVTRHERVARERSVHEAKEIP